MYRNHLRSNARPDPRQVIEKVREHLATPQGRDLLHRAVEEVRRASTQLREAAKIDPKSLHEPMTL